MRFVKITVEILSQNPSLADYLRRADIKPAKKGGAFVGNYEVAPKEFLKYGIVLSGGGMIIPDAEPDRLKEIVKEPDRQREAEDIQTRRRAEGTYLKQVRAMLAKSGVLDIRVVVKNGKYETALETPSWHRSFFVVGKEEVFTLHSEEEPYHGLNDDNSYESWRTSYTPLEKVELFLQEEARLAEPRKLFADRINRLIEMSHAVGQQQLDEDDNPRVQLLIYDDYSQPNDWQFFGHRSQNVFSAHRILFREKIYEITKEDITLLEREVGDRAEKAATRQEMIKKLFFEQLGVFSYEARRYEPSETRHSFVDGRVIDDSWTERHYFLEQTEVTREEYEWLNTFLGEIKLPDEFIRVVCDTNELLPILDIPGRKDVLVVEGKTGSHRGVWSYGEWFRGHPSKCDISFLHKGTARSIKTVSLNGEFIESKYVDLDKWRKPEKLAEWALEQAGIKVSMERVEALAEAYKKQLK